MVRQEDIFKIQAVIGNLLLPILVVHFKQEISANAHEMFDSISLILYAGCLGLSPVISAKMHHLNVRQQPEIVQNSVKPPVFGFYGCSRSLMLVPLERSSALLVMISCKSVSICNRSHARLVNSSRNHTF